MVSRFIERRQQADWNLEAAVLQTVAYFSLFKYPLSQWEVWSFLPHKAELLAVRQVLDELTVSGGLVERWGYYFLPGQEATVECRQQRYPSAVRKMKLARRVASWLAWLPGVQFIALANLMGTYNLRDGGDIDLFIITRPGCLWVCRFWAALILQLFGLRPTPDNRRDKICLSFWLSSDNLRIDQFKLPDESGCPDWYYIYWLANLRPLIEQGVTYHFLVKQNPWLKTYLPNWRPGRYQSSHRFCGQCPARVISSTGAWLARPWERLLAYWQQRFLPIAVKDLMNKDQRVVVNSRTIKLHTIDRRRYFREKLLAALESLARGQTEPVKADPLVKVVAINWWARLAYWSSLALCLVLPWSTRWIIKAGSLGGTFWEYGTISLYASDILLALALASNWLARRTAAPNQPAKGGQFYGWWLTGLWLISGIGLLMNLVDFSLAWFVWLRLIFWSAGWWLLIIWQGWSLRRWINYVLIGLLVPAIIGVGQFASQTASGNKWLGLAAHRPSDLGVSVVEATNGFGQITGRWLRAYGSFDQPNILGAVMALAILLVLISWRRATSNLGRSFLLLATGLWLLALLFSWSRAAYLAVIFGWLVALWLGWRDVKQRKFLLVFLLAIAAWSVLWLWPFRDLSHSRLTGQTRLEKKSLTERAAGYQQAIQLMRPNLWFGVGLNNYTATLSQQSKEVEPAWVYQPVHNSIALIIVEVGIFGGLWFIIGLLALARRAQQNRQTVWPIVVGVIWLMLLDHWWWSLHGGLALFWLLAAILSQVGRQRPNLL